MRKTMLIILLTALLSGCANTAKEESAGTKAVSQTTTAAVITSETESTTTAEITAAPTVTTAETTSTSKTSTTVSETKKSEKTSTTTKKTTSVTTKNQTKKGDVQTYVINVSQPVTQQTNPVVTVTETKPATTTVQTTTLTTTTTQAPPPETPDETSGIEWSDSMLVWRKLCEGFMLSDAEQDVIRAEILDYAMQNFNGKKDIHVKFGNDEYDISYEKPLNMTINYGMTSMANAHMDAYVDANRKDMIDYASDENEIYDLVSETREKCLHIIDYGLFNRWEIFSINNSLKYAFDIEFNVGFDEDMAIWFLTQD